jgi:hypothetical protein
MIMRFAVRSRVQNEGFSTIGFMLMIVILALAGLCCMEGSSLEAPAVARRSSQVSTASSQTKKIEDIKVGDWVLAKDPGDLGPPTPHRVVALPRNWTEHIVHVRVQGGGELQATRMHPFWVEGRGWTEAKTLRRGDGLRDDKGCLVAVTAIEVEDKTTDTFNLTVEGVHTYYALAGDIPVLVHNLIVVTPGGTAIPIPTNATGPVPVINPGGKTTGFAYTGGSGGYGMSPRTSNVRIMDPTLPKGPSPGYPNGYTNYQNASGQGVNPKTGQTIGKSDPAWHNPCQ